MTLDLAGSLLDGGALLLVIIGIFLALMSTAVMGMWLYLQGRDYWSLIRRGF